MESVAAMFVVAGVTVVGACLVLGVVALIARLIGSPVVSLEQKRFKIHFELMRALHDLDVMTNDAHARIRASRGGR